MKKQIVPYSEDPFREMTRMIDEMQGLMHSSFPWPDRTWFDGGRSSGLTLNMSEDEKNIVVEALVPGLSEDDVDVEIVGDTLHLSGAFENRREENDDQRQWHLIERSYGRFDRAVRLPADVDAGKVKAELDNGVLTITLPKSQPSPVKKITVQARKLLNKGK